MHQLGHTKSPRRTKILTDRFQKLWAERGMKTSTDLGVNLGKVRSEKDGRRIANCGVSVEGWAVSKFHLIPESLPLFGGRVVSFVLVAVAALFWAGCTSFPPDGLPIDRRPRAIPVSMPGSLNANEQRHVHTVEAALRENGYRPVAHSGAEYRLEFTIESGPVNTDTNLRLIHGGEIEAQSYARAGGPRYLFDKQRAADDSFSECMAEFRRRLPLAH